MVTIYRALVNVRQTKPISEDFLQVEDEYIQEELKNNNITDVKDIKTIKEKYTNSILTNSDKICLWQGDITKLKHDELFDIIMPHITLAFPFENNISNL